MEKRIIDEERVSEFGDNFSTWTRSPTQRAVRTASLHPLPEFMGTNPSIENVAQWLTEHDSTLNHHSVMSDLESLSRLTSTNPVAPSNYDSESIAFEGLEKTTLNRTPPNYFNYYANVNWHCSWWNVPAFVANESFNDAISQLLTNMLDTFCPSTSFYARLAQAAMVEYVTYYFSDAIGWFESRNYGVRVCCGMAPTPVASYPWAFTCTVVPYATTKT